MNYKNVESWKNSIKKIARKRNLDIQQVQERYVLEEFAIKIGASSYKDLFIIKGGFVVSTLLGIDTRMTRDIDLTSKQTIYSKEHITEIINEIINTESGSFFSYHLADLQTAQEDDQYNGYIAKIDAIRENTKIRFKLDISNNSLIFPQEIEDSLDSMFFENKIILKTQRTENIIAEKFETTLDRGEFNTRIKDLLDVYFLLEDQKNTIDENILIDTIIMVSKDRDTTENLMDTDEILDYLENSKIFKKNFDKYRDEQYPNSSLELSTVIKKFRELSKKIEDTYINDEEMTI